MTCDKCNNVTHRDDSMNRRCNGCERLVRQCICKSKEGKRKITIDVTVSDVFDFRYPGILVDTVHLLIDALPGVTVDHIVNAPNTDLREKT